MKTACHCPEERDVIVCPSGHRVVQLRRLPGSSSLEVVADGSLYYHTRCPTCGQMWRIQKAQKQRPRLAVKVPSEGACEFDDTPLRLKFLEERLGLADGEICRWARCESTAAKDYVFCPRHLYVFSLVYY